MFSHEHNILFGVVRSSDVREFNILEFRFHYVLCCGNKLPNHPTETFEGPRKEFIRYPFPVYNILDIQYTTYQRGGEYLINSFRLCYTGNWWNDVSFIYIA